MARISTTAPGMAQAATSMEATVQHTDSARTRVESTVDSLLTSFTGDQAAPEFKRAMDAWSADTQSINNSLRQMIEVLHGNRQTIVSSEQAAGDVAHSIPVGPGMSL